MREYTESFEVSDEILNDFTEFAQEESGIELKEDDLEISRSLIKQTIKGEIARQLCVEQGFYQVQIKNDVDVQEALKSLK